MLRAGPFSDERVIRLANRRFIPFYFDLSDRGAAGDPDARRFVVARRPELGGRSVATPPVLFMDSRGSVLGEVSNYASADEVLATMLRVLRENPELAHPSPHEEQVQDPVEKARIAMDLQELEEARRILKDAEGDRAAFLRARLARWRGDWEALEEHLRGVQDPDLADDVRMERAYPLWHAGEFARLERHLKGFPEDSNRYTEARYHLGLALYHQGRVEPAREVWKATIKGCSQDPWIYRADWAFCNTAEGAEDQRAFTSTGPRRSLLSRIGYMGRRNPDLEAPGR